MTFLVCASRSTGVGRRRAWSTSAPAASCSYSAAPSAKVSPTTGIVSARRGAAEQLRAALLALVEDDHGGGAGGLGVLDLDREVAGAALDQRDRCRREAGEVAGLAAAMSSRARRVGGIRGRRSHAGAVTSPLPEYSNVVGLVPVGGRRDLGDHGRRPSGRTGSRIPAGTRSRPPAACSRRTPPRRRNPACPRRGCRRSRRRSDWSARLDAP